MQDPLFAGLTYDFVLEIVYHLADKLASAQVLIRELGYTYEQVGPTTDDPDIVEPDITREQVFQGLAKLRHEPINFYI